MKILTTLNATERGAMIAAIVAISSLLVSCANFVPPSGPKGGQNNPWIVTIKFQGISKCKIQSVTAENNTCGLSDPAEICVRQSKFLEWQSDPNGVGFNIYFDPIKGGPNYTAPNGKKKVHVDANAPPGFYKYSILGRDSSCDPDTDTVDPMIRVDK